MKFTEARSDISGGSVSDAIETRVRYTNQDCLSTARSGAL